MIHVALSLGTNLGERRKNMDGMLASLKKVLFPPVKVSPLMETEPLDVPDKQEWYYNCIISGMFDGTARTLLEVCREIEIQHGRDNKNTLQARTADIDILLIDDCIITEKDFTVPHPHLLIRRFCIEGVYSIEPEWIHPREKKTIRELYQNIDARILKQKIRFIEL